MADDEIEGLKGTASKCLLKFEFICFREFTYRNEEVFLKIEKGE